MSILNSVFVGNEGCSQVNGGMGMPLEESITSSESFFSAGREIASAVDTITAQLSSDKIERCTALMSGMHRYYRHLYKQDHAKALELEPCLSLSHNYLQILNNKASVVAHRSIGPVRSFFMAGNKVYAANSGKIYREPDRVSVLNFTSDFFNDFGEEAFGVKKHYEYNQGVLDLVYFTKSDRQIAYEKKGALFAKEIEGIINTSRDEHSTHLKSSTSMFHRMKKRFKLFRLSKHIEAAMQIKKQTELLERVSTQLADKYKGWRYSGFQVCGNGELVKYGFDGKVAQKLFAIVLTYKCENQTLL